jgi:hypothetical protein
MIRVIAATSVAILTMYVTASAQASDCELPKPSAAAKVVLLSTHQTEALSSAALGSQDDVTSFGTINVEAGNEPLYVVIVSGRPTIWRFAGSIERVERVVVASFGGESDHKAHDSKPRAGAIGLPAERVSFPQRARCLDYFFAVPPPGSTKIVAAVKAATGKDPAVVVAQYRTTAFNVPSGKIEAIGSGAERIQVRQAGGTFIVEPKGGKLIFMKRDGNPSHELYLFNPAGVVSVDARKVVAAVPVAPYAVLPEEAGLAQLLKAGALSRDGNGEFLINTKIRFPAGLSGLHTVKFVLRTGVAKPEGDPGDSAVVWEGTGLRVDLP